MPEPNPKPAVTIPDHELIRPIGCGSYGEVWLARSILGEYRAVKIVRRDSFDHDRPVERELEGIQKYEPISRSHEHQVHILHVGKLAEGFYYVMELADDGSHAEERRGKGETELIPSAPLPLFSSASYVPRTLRSEVRLRGRLPIAECVDIALKLTDALGHLHGHGLVHRDVKPSNIIFVRNQPKLADIGLVASADSSLSCVGTEGFLPPEGPGKPQADLYALGKVLYEISTGRDRHDFPELPTMLRDDPQRRALEEFNEVVLKACDPDVRRRYPTARAMQTDLELLRAGKSLQQIRRRERHWRSARKLAIAAAVLALLGGLIWNARRGIPAATRPLPDRLAVDGATFWRLPFFPRQFDFSPDGERIVFGATNQISIWERTTRITRRLELRDQGQWKIAGVRGAVSMPRWAPDSRRFMFQAVRTIGGTPDDPVLNFAFMLVDAQTGEMRQIGSEMPEAERADELCWRPDGRAVTYEVKPRQLVTLSLEGERTAWKEFDLAGAQALRLGSYSPDGAWALVATGGPRPDEPQDRDLWAISHLGGTAKRLIQRPGIDAFPTWGPDGESIWFVSTDNPDSNHSTWGIWKLPIDPKTMTPKAPAAEFLARSGVKFLHPKFVDAGRKLAYAVEEPKTDIWVSAADAMEAGSIVARGADPIPSPDGQIIYFVASAPISMASSPSIEMAKSGP